MIENFGQREPLTTRLGGLLTEYPPGVSILKELLQNADDAGARTVVEPVQCCVDF
jgi:sacsin